MSLAEFFPYFQFALGLFVVVGTVIGGVIAVRHGYSKSADEIQDRVIKALKNEIGTLETQFGQAEKEIIRLRRVLATIRYALKRRGLHITVNGDFISFYDEQSRSTRTTQMRTTDQQGVEDALERTAVRKEDEDIDEDAPQKDEDPL